MDVLVEEGEISPAAAAALYTLITILPDSELDALLAGVAGIGKAASTAGKLSKGNVNSKVSLPLPEDLPRTIHEGQQGKHIKHHNNYKDYSQKSYFYNNINPQELLDGIHKKQYPVVSYGARGNPVVDFGKVIGVDFKSNLSTRFGQIHYGKKGVHIVPHNPNLIK